MKHVTLHPLPTHTPCAVDASPAVSCLCPTHRIVPERFLCVVLCRPPKSAQATWMQAALALLAGWGRQQNPEISVAAATEAVEGAVPRPGAWRPQVNPLGSYESCQLNSAIL